MSDEWRYRRVSDILERVAKPVQVQSEALYQQIGIRSHGKGLFLKEPVTGAALGNKRVFWVEPNCFIVNIVFAWEQAVGRTTDDLVGKIASHRFPMYRSKNGGADVDYLNYFFRSPRGKYLLGLASPGGAGRNKTLGQKEFERLALRVPALGGQQKIAEILSTWDAAIETREKLLANAERQKRGLMQQLLTGKRRFSQFSSPWRQVILSDLADVVMGSSPPSSAYNDASEGLPLIQGNADLGDGISAPRSFTSVTTQACRPGDSLLSVRAPVGAVARSQHHACIGRGIAAVRAKKPGNQEWLHQFLLWFEPRWSNLSQGSTFEAVNGKEIRCLHLLAPTSDREMARISDVLADQDQVVRALSHQVRGLHGEKHALTQQLLTGKRRVTV